jgi:Major tropism determinant N-terminal domain
MAIKIQLRRGTAANWTSTNPILSDGEVGFESDTGKFKIGRSNTAWTDLAYATDLPSEVTGLVSNLSNTVTSHTSATTSVHGIADTSALETKTGAQTKADGAVTTAGTYTDSELYAHNSSILNVHGIANTATLETKTGAQTKADAAESAAKGYADSIVSNLVDSAPTLLNTLNELATALNDDPAFATTITNSIATKATLVVDTSSNLTTANAAIAANSFVLESNTGKFKIGNGTTHWTALPYAGTTSTEITDLTAQLETYANDMMTYHMGQTTNVHGIANVADLVVSSTVTSHTGATTNIHGIANTALLVTTAILDTHTGSNVNVHGIANTALLLTTTDLANIDANLALKAPTANATFTGTTSGITKAMVGLGNVDNTSDVSKPISNATQNALNLKASSESPTLSNTTFTQNVTGLTKTMVGLGSVDNTADLDKPISTATQAGLNLKAPIANATLTGTVVLPATTSIGNVSATEIGYVDGVTSAIQTQINAKAPSESATLANTSFTGTISGITKAVVGLSNVDNTADANKPVSTAQQSALNAKANLSGDTFTGGVVISANTASTSATSGALIVAGGIGTKGNIHSEGTAYFGAPTNLDLTDPLAFFTKDTNSYIQLGVQNTNSGNHASGDLVITADNGTNSSKFVDLGIASSTYNYSDYSAINPNDSYLIADGGNLVLDAGTGGKAIKFVIGGTQSTDLKGSWDATKLEVANNFKVDGNAQIIGTLSAADTTVSGLNTGDLDVTSVDGTYTPVQIMGTTDQTADLTQWQDATGATLAKIDAAGNITAPTFSGTAIGNLSYYGNNNTQAIIAKGTPICFTGLDSNNNATIAPAVVSDSSKMPATGIAGQDIAVGSTGQIVFVGQIHNIDTSAFALGDILYVGSTGLTNVKPTNVNYSIQHIGTVEKVASAINGGAILVNCTGTTVQVPNIVSIPGNITTTGGTFTGNGSGLTTLNASNLSSGTVPSARLSLSSSDIPTLASSKISDLSTVVHAYTLNSFANPVSAVSMANQKITNLADPTSGLDAANKSYVDNLSSGLRIKQAVDRATDNVLPNTPTYTAGSADSSQGYGIGATLESSTNTRLSVDNGNVTTGQRILVKNQTDAKQNGIYYVTAQGASGSSHWILTRATDSDNSPAGEVRKGDYVSVLNGGTNGGTSWTISNDGTATTPSNGIAIGIDNINYVQFNGAATYVAGGGLTLTGTTFDIGTADSSRIVINADNIDLATVTRSDTTGSAGGARITAITTDSYGRVTGTVSSAQADATTTTKGIASFDSGDFAVTSGAVTIKAAGVDNSQLANAKVTLGTTDLTLGSTVTSVSGLGTVAATTFSGALIGNVTGNASTVTNGVYTTDTATVTNAMLAGSIADSKLSTISTAGKVLNSATTATQLNTANAIVARDASGNFTANIITAALSGNATTATNATSATSAVNTGITEDTTTNASKYITWVDANTGNNPQKTTSTKLTFNPSTGIVSATGFSGAYTVSSAGITFSDGSVQLVAGVPSLTTIAQKTASYTLTSLAERDTITEIANASAQTLTVPLDTTLSFPTGTTLDLIQTGAGQITITPATTTSTYSSGGAAAATTFVIAATNAAIGIGQTVTGTGFAANTVVTNVSGTTITVSPAITSQVSGTITFATTINATPGLKLRTQWSSATLLKRSANTWLVYGDLTA